VALLRAATACWAGNWHVTLEKRRRGVEIETSPSRLGLARVSVVRGEGRQAGKACIDDYIRATEPVYDYLTQYRYTTHSSERHPLYSTPDSH